MRRRRPSVPLVLAALAFDLALVPTLLPRPWWVAGIFAGVAAAQAYVLAAAVVVLLPVVRRVGASRRQGGPAPATVTAAHGRSGLVGWGVLAALLVLTAVAGQLRQVHLEQSMGLTSGSVGDQLAAQTGAIGLGLLTSVVLAGAVLLLGRALRRLVRLLARTLARWRAVRVALMVPVVALAGCIVSATGSTPASALARQPRSAPVAAVPADVGADRLGAALGPKAREFLGGVTPTSAISRAVGHPARQPVRVYAELRPGESDTARAARGVRELRRAGALDRAFVVLVVPTGSGWVDPAAVTAVETLTGGDVATLAVQYNDVPSWVAYLQGAGRAERSAVAALSGVRALVDSAPAAHRPRLLLYGESLGALGGLRAQAAVGGQGVDDALWVGVPSDVAQLGDQARRHGQTVLVHPDDPVAAWSATLLLRPTTGWRAGWWPVVTFWQATADLVSAYSTPDGYGHRYGAELVDAWGDVLSRSGRRDPTLPGVRQLVTRASDAGSSLPSRTPQP
jgi:uncharacterized membrane protein